MFNFNNKLMKILGACTFLLILSFALIGGVYADNPVKNADNDNVKDLKSVKSLSVNDDSDDDEDDNWDDDWDGSDDDDWDDDWDGSDDDNWDDDWDDDWDDGSSNYRMFEWKGYTHFIDMDQFNLTDEELTELFTKRDALMGDIDNLEFLIHEKWLSRSNNTLLAIDDLYNSINTISNNTKFNDLLLALKKSNIFGIDSIFADLKSLLESIKAEYPDEDFSEVDSLMDNLETLLNEDSTVYQNSHSELDEKLAELSYLFDRYPFLRDYTKYNPINLHNYYRWEWKGYIYYIDRDQFNLTDEELTELFTKRDALMEEIDNLEFLIHEMELSRSDDTLLAIDVLYDSMNSIVNNDKFNELLLGLKDININEINSTFNELKILLDSIKAEYPDEDFSEVDSLVNNLETLLNGELERYENLNSQLDEKLAELFDLFEKYPFLRDHTKYNYYLTDFVTNTAYAKGHAGNLPGDPLSGGNNSENNFKSFNKVSAGMKNTGIPIIATLLVLLSILGIFLGKRQE